MKGLADMKPQLGWISVAVFKTVAVGDAIGPRQDRIHSEDMGDV